jgi:hypothetical protein
MLQVHPKSYLRQRGWFRSFAEKRSIDAKGTPIPWWSYGVIDFVDERLNESMSILEFGSGGSTAWLASRVSRVVTVENDPAWAALVKAFVPDNVSVIELRAPGELAVRDLANVPGEHRFHVLIVDSLANRIECAMAGVSFLAADGIVLWDNTDGKDWPTIKELMARYGFKEISFSGPLAQAVSEDRTTIFYRRDNVFGI